MIAYVKRIIKSQPIMGYKIFNVRRIGSGISGVKSSSIRQTYLEVKISVQVFPVK